VIAAVASAVLLLGDFHREQARLDYNFAHAEAASRLLAPWPEPLDTEARVHLLKAIVTNDDPAEVQRSRQIREDAIRRAPTDPSLWNEAGELDAAFGFHASAAKNFSGALRHNPWSLRALVGLARAQLALGQPAQAVAPLRKALQLTNSPTVKRLLATAESRAKP
jgi:predicted Zn-dependent protease